MKSCTSVTWHLVFIRCSVNVRIIIQVWSRLLGSVQEILGVLIIANCPHFLSSAATCPSLSKCRDLNPVSLMPVEYALFSAKGNISLLQQNLLLWLLWGPRPGQGQRTPWRQYIRQCQVALTDIGSALPSWTILPYARLRAAQPDSWPPFSDLK